MARQITIDSAPLQKVLFYRDPLDRSIRLAVTYLLKAGDEILATRDYGVEENIDVSQMQAVISLLQHIQQRVNAREGV